MKRTFSFRNAFALALAFCLALAAIPASALPRFDVKAEVTPSWTVPAGYNIHDYTKCVEFLEQTDADGVKNGEKLSDTYDPNDPGTWGVDSFRWTATNGEQRLLTISAYSQELYGSLDVSGCTALERLNCYYNNLSELDVSGCTALEELLCSFNNLSELDVSGCTALERLYCYSNNLGALDVSGCIALEVLGCTTNNLSELDVSGCTSLWELGCSSNNLSELDVSGCTALKELWCSYNNLSELDVTQNTALEVLSCSSNNLSELDVSGCTALGELYCDENNLSELDVSNNTALRRLMCDSNNLSELDLSNNTYLPYDTIIAEGDGFIGYRYYDPEDSEDVYVYLYAYPNNNASFEGFFDETGALISEGVWSGYYGAYIYCIHEPVDLTGTVIARFSGGAAVPGDVDGNGSVSVADAITTLRLAMQLSDGSGMNTDAADMDGNGSITIADAIVILRTAMGLA